MKIHISTGNVKLGRIPNISLPPVLSCRPGVPCADLCYAQKAWRMYAGTRQAWSENLAMYQEDPQKYFTQIQHWMQKKNPRFFRWHVAGDIPDQQYWHMLRALCTEVPDTKFLLFTKRFELDFEGYPIPNLSVVLSMWPGMSNPPELLLPRAWCQDGSETRVPADALECPGNCATCAMCWNLKEIERDVVFQIH